LAQLQIHWHRLPACFRTLVSERPQSILLETSRFDSLNSRSYLFLEPKRTIVARALGDIPHAFRQIDAALHEGCHVAGFLAYEAGYHFAEVKVDHVPSTEPLAWFGVYGKPCIFDHQSGAVLGAAVPPGAFEPKEGQAPAMVHWRAPAAMELSLPKPEYIAKIQEIQELIAQGETYQVNFTDQISFAANSPASLYATLAGQHPVSYGAYLNLSDHQILSFSPELFFRMQNGVIDTRPMKGTIPRGLDEEEDVAQAERLRNDAKNRAEHVMIVDLLRNDLGRICQPGSVQPSHLYTVERYQTLHQMTTMVSGKLSPHVTHYEIFRSLFPCGSITGAPKIRTMQIIRDLERRPRGVYSGAIGFIAPDGLTTFSVAIRTLMVKNGIARMGVGGGIVADSDPRDEYKECLLKASFLNHKREDFELLETLLWQHDYRLLEYHLDRLGSSARYFGFRFDRELLLQQLRQSSAAFTVGKSYRVRLALDDSGRAKLQSTEFVPQNTSGIIRIIEEHTQSDDVFRRHKSTVREPYDRLYAQALAEGLDDVLFMNEREELTEGAISNLFVEKDGIWLTPPITCGVLPGVFRRHLLETLPNVQERVLRVEDVQAAEAIYLCNALRGLRRVHLERA
jgi:para-aminobenzoate synthetase / 4-amino-4-deoxychorismate lyase